MYLPVRRVFGIVVMLLIAIGVYHLRFDSNSDSAAADGPPSSPSSSKGLYPALYLCHGGGPLPALGDPDHRPIVNSWRELVKDIVDRHGPPRAIAVVSAHYNTDIAEVGSHPSPPMYYDYSGFPPESYKLSYTAPGDPSLAEEMVKALQADGIIATANPTRPYDHGVFVPLLMTFESQTVPVVPISVLRNDNATDHIKIGVALRRFRKEGVFFIGSGSSMHHFDYLVSSRRGVGTVFNNALTKVLSDPALSSEERIEKMKRVSDLDGFSEAHPKRAQEHLMPLLTLLGTADGRAAREVASLPFYSANVRHYLFEE